MSDEMKLAVRQLSKPSRDWEAARRPKSDIVRDALIQRFEFTFELLWKTLKLFLEDQGILVFTPKDALREAFRLGWLREEDIFLKMLEARNKMSHVYDEAEARKIAKEIHQRFLKPIQKLLLQLKNQSS